MIRSYTAADKSKVMTLLKQNTPAYFDCSEEKDFNRYLDHEIEDYFVFEQQSEIIGAGGINYFPEKKMARISWDVIAPKSHGQGIGKKLMHYRIRHLNTNPDVELIVVRTTQLVYPFYEKMGFELKHIEKDFWAKNFDLYQLQMTNKTNRHP